MRHTYLIALLLLSTKGYTTFHTYEEPTQQEWIHERMSVRSLIIPEGSPKRQPQPTYEEILAEAKILYQQSNFHMAIEYFKECKRLDAQMNIYSDRTARYLAHSYFLKRDYDNATTVWEEYFILAPQLGFKTTARDHLYFAKSAFYSGHHNISRFYYKLLEETGVELGTEDKRLHALSCYGCDEFEVGLKKYLEVIALKVQQNQALNLFNHFNLSMMYYKNNDLNGYQVHLQEVFMLYPTETNPVKLQLLKDLMLFLEEQQDLPNLEQTKHLNSNR